jgi:hypothetical protein
VEIKVFEMSYGLILVLGFLCGLISITIYVHEKEEVIKSILTILKIKKRKF